MDLLTILERTPHNIRDVCFKFKDWDWVSGSVKDIGTILNLCNCDFDIFTTLPPICAYNDSDPKTFTSNCHEFSTGPPFGGLYYPPSII